MKPKSFEINSVHLFIYDTYMKALDAFNLARKGKDVVVSSYPQLRIVKDDNTIIFYKQNLWLECCAYDKRNSVLFVHGSKSNWMKNFLNVNVVD